MSDLAEPWGTWATKAGVRPTMTGIGEAAGLPASTISRLMKGRTTPATVRAVADALRVTQREILAAATGESLGPWEPPLESHLLDAQEREALSLLIMRLTAERSANDGRQPEAEKTTPTPISAAQAKRDRMLRDAQMMDDAAYEDDPDNPGE